MGEHSEYRIYDECGHDHREGDPGTTEVNDVGICCEDGYLYSLCYRCDTDDGELLENSPTEQAWPCEVQQGLDKIKELEKSIRCAHSTLMAHRSSWVREVAERMLGRLEHLAGKEAEGE